MIGNRCDPAVLQIFNRFLDPSNRGRIHDHALARIVPQSAAEQLHLSPCLALVHHIAQILSMEAGDIKMRIAHLQLLQNVVPHLPGRTGCERCDWSLRKART